MHGLATEVLAQEHVPVGLEVGVHMLFNCFSDFDAVLFKVVLLELLL